MLNFGYDISSWFQFGDIFKHLKYNIDTSCLNQYTEFQLWGTNWRNHLRKISDRIWRHRRRNRFRWHNMLARLYWPPLPPPSQYRKWRPPPWPNEKEFSSTWCSKNYFIFVFKLLSWKGQGWLSNLFALDMSLCCWLH